MVCHMVAWAILLSLAPYHLLQVEKPVPGSQGGRLTLPLKGYSTLESGPASGSGSIVELTP